jgi:putative Holliday junction resolvase
MKRALGIDFGEARIGLAVSDELGMLAHPLETIVVKDTRDPLARVVQLATEKDVGHVVVGLPKNMDGTSGPAAEKARAFADKLRERLPCPIRLWDERLTTVAAQRYLHDAGRNTKQSRAVIDQVAAVIILQGWLDSQGGAG